MIIFFVFETENPELWWYNELRGRKNKCKGPLTYIELIHKLMIYVDIQEEKLPDVRANDASISRRHAWWWRGSLVFRRTLMGM